MIQWLICRILGHKTVHDVFTGEYGVANSPMYGQTQVPVIYKERAPFCLRCGKDVPY